MSAPAPVVWAVVKERDGQRCVSCGARSRLQFQHRRTEGMGGRLAAPKLEEGLTSCWECNPAYEGHLQRVALRFGWKVRGWVIDQGRGGDVPVFYRVEQSWFRLEAGARLPISEARAVEMMRDVYGEQYEEWRDAA